MRIEATCFVVYIGLIRAKLAGFSKYLLLSVSFSTRLMLFFTMAKIALSFVFVSNVLKYK
jgi:hypothetical protein